MPNSELNRWITKSMELAASRGYLDKLLDIYPLTPNKERKLPEGSEEEIKQLVEDRDKGKLIKFLLGLELFPIRCSYTSSLRYEGIREKNPRTIDQIGDILLEMGTDGIIKAAKEPKIVSKQSGAMFARWIQQQYDVKKMSEFEDASGTSILGGSDKVRKVFANENLHTELPEKGIDLLLKKDSKFLMGQAKFITAGGGGQDNQFFEALRFVNSTNGNAERVAILDGVIWFNDGYLNKIKTSNKNIMSALLLKDFVDEL